MSAVGILLGKRGWGGGENENPVAQGGSSVEDGDPEKVMKGRAVFRGDIIKDQSDKYAIFDDKSSNPASCESAKCGVN